MIRTECDTCHEPIDRDAGGWFGVDWTPPPVPLVTEDGYDALIELHELGVDHEFHFCSADHLVVFAMNRAFQPQATEAT